MFSIGCLKFLESYNFLAKTLDQMAKIYGCKTKTLYPYEYFGLDTWGTTTKSYDSEAANVSRATYQEVIGNLKIENFKSSLSRINNQHKKKSISLIKTTVIKMVKI